MKLHGKIVDRATLLSHMDHCLFKFDYAPYLAYEQFKFIEQDEGLGVWAIGSNEDKYLGHFESYVYHLGRPRHVA